MSMGRPVKCHFCKGKMYYSNEPRHEPEVRIDVLSREDGTTLWEKLYAHNRCLKDFLPKKIFNQFNKVIIKKEKK